MMTKLFPWGFAIRTCDMGFVIFVGVGILSKGWGRGWRWAS